MTTPAHKDPLSAAPGREGGDATLLTEVIGALRYAYGNVSSVTADKVKKTLIPALEARLTTPPAPAAWRPIETAPDATKENPVDLWWVGDRWIDAFRISLDGTPGWAIPAGIVWLETFDEQPGPTHWMRVHPPSPDHEAGAEGGER